MKGTYNNSGHIFNLQTNQNGLVINFVGGYFLISVINFLSLPLGYHFHRLYDKNIKILITLLVSGFFYNFDFFAKSGEPLPSS